MKEFVKENLDLIFVIILIAIQIIIFIAVDNGIIWSSFRLYFIPVWLIIPCQLLGMIIIRKKVK